MCLEILVREEELLIARRCNIVAATPLPSSIRILHIVLSAYRSQSSGQGSSRHRLAHSWAHEVLIFSAKDIAEMDARQSGAEDPPGASLAVAQANASSPHIPTLNIPSIPSTIPTPAGRRQRHCGTVSGAVSHWHMGYKCDLAFGRYSKDHRGNSPGRPSLSKSYTPF